MSDGIELAVIGRGAIGAAVFAALSQAGRSAWVLEQEPKIGGGINEREGGVIHACLYYPAESPKTPLSGAELSGPEAEVRGLSAHLSESTGIVDPYEPSCSFLAAGEGAVGEVLVGAGIEAISRSAVGWQLSTGRSPVEAAVVVDAAGTHDPAEKGFVIREAAPRFINLVGIESPGPTSSFAPGRNVQCMYEEL